MALTKVRGSGLDASQEGAITFNEGSADVDFRVESNGNTHALFVDAGNDKVGVGTSSPDGALHVKGISDHGRIVLEAGGTSGSDNNMFMQFHNGGGTEIAQIEIGEGASNEGQIAFKTGGTTTAMTIDKDGRVTKPLTPHLFAVGFTSHVSGTDFGKFQTITTNTGSHYDNTTGRFTCPVDGRYLVTAFSGYKQSSNHLGLGIAVNGSILTYGWSENDDRHATQSCTLIHDASANDYFNYYNPSFYTTPSINNNYHSHFSVYLLG